MGQSMLMRIVSLALLASIAASASACTHVAAYQRGRLAHPTMTTQALLGSGEAHVYAVTEGAIGGTGGASSGCGCN